MAENREGISPSPEELVSELLEHLETARAICSSLKVRLHVTAIASETTGPELDQMYKAMPDWPKLDTNASRADREKAILDWADKARAFRQTFHPVRGGGATSEAFLEIELAIREVIARLLSM